MSKITRDVAQLYYIVNVFATAFMLICRAFLINFEVNVNLGFFVAGTFIFYVLYRALEFAGSSKTDFVYV